MNVSSLTEACKRGLVDESVPALFADSRVRGIEILHLEEQSGPSSEINLHGSARLLFLQHCHPYFPVSKGGNRKVVI